MKSGMKTAVSLLIAIVIFGVFAVASSLGVFSFVEQQFYEPSRLKFINARLDSIADCSNEYIQNLLVSFGYEENGFLSDRNAAGLVNQMPTDDSLRLFDSLREKNPCLDGMRIIEESGRRVFFSSFRNDYTVQNDKSARRRVYSNYENLFTPRGGRELDYAVVLNKEDSPKIVFDGEEQRIIISYYMSVENQKASGFCVLFYVSPVDFVNELIRKHIISVTENVTLVSSRDGKTAGFVTGLPKVGKQIFASEIIRKWNEKSYGPDEIVSGSLENFSGVSVDEKGEASVSENDKTESWSLISSSKGNYCFAGAVFSSESLVMPVYVRILLLLCAFITISLLILIVFSLKKDDDVIIKAKIKGIQVALLNEYFEQDLDKNKIAAMITAQKDSLTAKIKKSLGRRGKKYGDDLDVILNRSWADIISILSGEGQSASSGSSLNMEEIRRMFEEIISKTTLKVQPQPVVSATVSKSVEEAEPLEDVEALEEAEPLEDVEALEEVEALEDAEESPYVEELSVLEEAEPENSEAGEYVAEEPATLEEDPDIENIEVTGLDNSVDKDGSYVQFTSGEKINRRRFEGTEPLEIGDTTKFGQKDEPGAGDDFVIYQPFSEYADAAEKQSDDSGLEELSSEKDGGFMFTTFAANDTNVIDLPVDAIVLGDDGVFQISSSIPKIDMPIDEDFKKLVDSVIR